MKEHNQILLSEIDGLIKDGQSPLAAKRLKALRTKSFNAAERSLYASLARRLTLYSYSIRILSPVVRPEGRLRAAEATDEEKFEYAAALIKIGAFQEGLEILDTVTSTKSPKAILFRAFAHIGQWDYQGAIPILKEYIALPALSDYERHVGLANLCDSLVHERSPEADKIIAETMAGAKKNAYKIIYGYVELTQIDWLLERGDWETAAKAHGEAETIFKGTSTNEELFTRKWGAIIQLFKNNGSKKSIEALNVVRKEAIENLKHWETNRDCDFYQAVVTKDTDLALRLYHGTPFKSFKDRVVDHFPEISASLSSPYLWKMPLTANAGRNLDFFSGDGALHQRFLKLGESLQKLLFVLVSDFYRPIRIAPLSALLYPGEHYNVESTPTKVKFAVHRLRKWFQSEKVPLTIEEISGAFRLVASAPVEIVLPRPERQTAFGDLEIQFLMNKTKGSFSAKEVSKLLNISSRSANRVINSAIERGFLNRLGQGRASTYVWAQLSEKKAA